MAKEKLALSWNDFSSGAGEAFRSLRSSQHFSDVTLACGERQVEAHRAVLAASSTFFARILGRLAHPHPLVYLGGMEMKEVEDLLDFMYRGEAEVEEGRLEVFLRAGRELGVRGLGAAAGPLLETARGPRQPSSCSSEVEDSSPGETDDNENNTEEEKSSTEETVEESVNSEPEEVAAWSDLGRFVARMANSLEGRPVYQCSLCCKTAGQQHKLLLHVESCHFPGIIPHHCDFCGKSLATKCALKNHIHKRHKSKPSEFFLKL